MGNEPVGLGGARQRAVLAYLLVHRGEAVSVDRIADALWGASPPATATKTVQVYVSRLRKILGPEALATRGHGYALIAEPDTVDADRFERLAAEGRERFAAGAAGAAEERLHEALNLWRGEALADVAYESFARTEASRLEDLRLAVLEDRIDAELALGRHAALVPELEALAKQHPTRERLRGQLMLALYRSGRQTDALEAYREGRRRLADELGLEPGPELQRLERAILSQDSELDRPSPPARLQTIRRDRGAPLLVVGGVLLAAAVVAAWFGLTDDDVELAKPNSLAVIDPGSNELETTVPTGVDPTQVVADGRYVWVANRGDDTVSKVDAESRTVVATRSPGISVAGIAVGAGGVWIGDTPRGNLVRLDPELQAGARTEHVGPEEQDTLGTSIANPVAAGDGAVWVGSGYGSLARVDPTTVKVVDDVPVGNDPVAVETGAGAVWVVDYDDGTLARIDPQSANAVTWSTQVGQAPVALAVGEDGIWVASSQSDTVSRVDPENGAVTAAIPVGRRPTGVAVGAGAVWVTNSLDGTVSRIDPQTNSVAATIAVGEVPRSVTFADDRIWVTVQSGEPAPADESTEEVARVLVESDPGSTDPAIDIDFTRQGATCARLYNYPDRPAPEGAQLVPEIAAGFPEVSAGGRRYEFSIRSGYRFSPPSGEPVTAASFVRAIERTVDPRMGSYAGDLVGDMVGADAFAAGRAREITGLEARGNRLIVELTRPAGDLAARLSATFFCPVPRGTPVDRNGVELLPSAGPYYVASQASERTLVLRRNPNYEGPRPQGLAEIRYEIGWSPERAIAEIEAGRADYLELDAFTAEEPLSTADVTELDAQFGPGTEDEGAANPVLLTQPSLSTYMFAFNTTRPPFNDVRLRRAVSYAIDRRALAENTGFGDPARPTDQFLPPGIPGYEDAPVYPLGGPDLEQARRLAAGFSGPAVFYTCDFPDCARHAEILRSNLAAIGIDLTVRQFPLGEMFERTETPGEPFDVVYTNWFADFVDPANFLQMFDDAGFLGHLIDDPRLDQAFAHAAPLRGDRRLAAYARLDRMLVEDVVPAVAFANGTVSHLLSARMGCQILHPVYDLDLAALCIEGQ